VLRTQPILAWLLLIGGTVLIFGLDLWLEKSASLSPFAQVERRIPGGALFGVGLALFNLRPIRPILPFVASGLCWLTVGAMMGRLIGLVYIMGQSPKQWMWIAVELVVIVSTQVYLYRRVKSVKPSDLARSGS
jgi:hypothetical protein